MSIPYDKLNIPDQLQARFKAGMARQERQALASGLFPMSDTALIGVCYLLLGDKERVVQRLAKKTLVALSTDRLLNAITLNTHTKLLEFIAEFHPVDPELDERLFQHGNTNDRTVLLLARRAGGQMCETISRNHVRMLMTPEIIVELHANPRCGDAILSAAIGFMRMQGALPPLPPVRPHLRAQSAAPVKPPPRAAPTPEPSPAPQSSSKIDLQAEIEAALSGQQSPSLLRSQDTKNLEMFDVKKHDLGGFDFNFQESGDEFGWDLTGEAASQSDEDEDDQRKSVEVIIGEMTVGQKIKLAYKGNKEVRKVLIRDSNKTVATAVIRSGRLTDGEVASVAGNRNLSDDVIRELSSIKEYVRKYPVKVALAGNSKTPIPIAISMMKSLQKKDLKMLSQNRNVSSIISQSARKLFKKKYQKSGNG